MRATPFSRGLPVILAIAAIFLGGCRSQSPRFYALSPIQEDQVISKRKSPAQNAVIGIGPVKLADYLDQSMLITRTSDNQAVKAEYDRWVGSFKDNLINVLADDIGSLLSTERIYLYPWRMSVPIDYQVVLDIVRCDGRLGDAAWLEARWSIFKGPGKKAGQSLSVQYSRAGEGCGLCRLGCGPEPGAGPAQPGDCRSDSRGWEELKRSSAPGKVHSLIGKLVPRDSSQG